LPIQQLNRYWNFMSWISCSVYAKYEEFVYQACYVISLCDTSWCEYCCGRTWASYIAWKLQWMTWPLKVQRNCISTFNLHEFNHDHFPLPNSTHTMPLSDHNLWPPPESVVGGRGMSTVERRVTDFQGYYWLYVILGLYDIFRT
jgi:hypothetical protein